MLKWLIAGAVVLYGGFVVLLYAVQRRLQYFPERKRTTPRAAGLPETEEAVLDTADGERVIVWHVPPRQGRPVFLYFHGNGGSLRWRVERFRTLIADGSGLVALSYRGYGGSSGRPTERGLVEDAAAAYAFAAARYPAERIVLWGKSLGSASGGRGRSGKASRVPRARGALHLGRRCWRAALLVCPGAALHEGSVSIDLRVGKVTAPVLVVHGENDTTVPVALGERLYSLIRAPKQFVRLAGAGHNDLGDRAVAAAKQFIAEQSGRRRCGSPDPFEPFPAPRRMHWRRICAFER